MIIRRLRKKLKPNFTGGIIIDTYKKGIAPYCLVIFERGYLKDIFHWFSSFYENEEEPEELKNHLKKYGYVKINIYADTTRIVGEEDSQKILSTKKTLKLDSSMNCVE